jgi:3-oxoacyl-[acyl-carrier protein] reductase
MSKVHPKRTGWLPMFDLSGRVAVVTGGSRGIGRAISLLLAGHGARVVVNYRSNARAAQATAREITACGGECITVQADVSKPEEVHHLMDEALEAYGRIDILVNNAGLTRDDLLMRMSEEKWNRVLDANLHSAFLCTRAALRPMVRQRWGRVISISSAGGIVGNPGQANYAAAKAGLIGLTKAVAKEVASRNITANAIAPGFVETESTRNLTDAQRKDILEMIPLGRSAKPDEIAPAVLFLASEEAAYITGHVLNVDGGVVMH